ncbi:MAG: hypothetical protein ACI9E5_001507 [Candidatus Omnitrophota bacterium]|jgi:hypothetical protein
MPVNEIVAKRRGKAKVKISEKRKVTKALLKKFQLELALTHRNSYEFCKQLILIDLQSLIKE